MPEEKRSLGSLVKKKAEKEKPLIKAPAKKAKATAAEYKPATVRIKPAAKTQLDILALELGMKQQELLGTALNALFEKHGKDQIA